MTTSATTAREVRNTVEALNDKVTQVMAQNDRILERLDGVTTVKKDDDDGKKTSHQWNIMVEDEDEKERLRVILEGFRANHGEWLDTQSRTRAQAKEILEMETQAMNDGLKGFQGRLFNTINNFLDGII